MKTNFKISQFSSFLPRSGYPILVKIWQWLKLLNSFPFIKKTLVNHVDIRIWLFWFPFTVLQWMKKISEFSSFLLRSGYAISVKNWSLIIFTDFHSFTVNEDKLQNLSIFKFPAKVRVCDFIQNLRMTKTS